MPCSNANAKYSKLQELQCVGLSDLTKIIILNTFFENQTFWLQLYPEEGAITHRSLGQSQSGVSCSMPKLWPISWATVVATRPLIKL